MYSHIGNECELESALNEFDEILRMITLNVRRYPVYERSPHGVVDVSICFDNSSISIKNYSHGKRGRNNTVRMSGKLPEVIQDR